MSDQLRTGDEVTWHSHGHTVSGTVLKKITRRTRTAGRTVDATSDEPQFLVRSDKSGRTAVHKPDSLHRKA
jgi:hypothetical protein